jgi:chaperonin cofactor prefoldin
MSKKKWLLAIIIILAVVYFLGYVFPWIPLISQFTYYVDLAFSWVTMNVAGLLNLNPTFTNVSLIGAGASVIGLFAKLYSTAKAKVAAATQQTEDISQNANTAFNQLQTQIGTLQTDNAKLKTDLNAALDGNKIITDLQTQNTQLRSKIQELQSDYNAVIRTAAVKVSIPTEPPRVP